MAAAVNSGEAAVENSRRLFAGNRRGPRSIPEIREDQIDHQLGLAVDRVMAEGALYDRKAAAAAIKQAQGDLVEAIFLVRVFRTTLKRFGSSKPIDTENMPVIRRISGAFKDIPGGQVLGPTYDHTLRLIEFGGARDAKAENRTPADDTPGETGPPEDIAMETLRGRRVVDILEGQGLIDEGPEVLIGGPVEDLTRESLEFPASRPLQLQNLARGDEGFLLGCAHSLQRGFSPDQPPYLGELRVGYVDLRYTPPELGFEICVGQMKITECFTLNRFDATENKAPGFESGYGLVFGHNERKAMSVSLLDRSLPDSGGGGDGRHPARDQEFILSHSDNVESSGFVQNMKLPHYVDFQSELALIRALKHGHPAERTERLEPSV